MSPSLKTKASIKDIALHVLFGLLLAGTLAAAGVLSVMLSITAPTHAAQDDIPISGLSQAVSGPTASATASPSRTALTRTPFRPQTYTPTPSNTPTPTATPTATATATATPTPTPTVTPTATPTVTAIPTDMPPPAPHAPPEAASVAGVTGYAQTYTLSCESRSAVDWARFFGVNVGEVDFQEHLPKSDNPNLGFVGSPNGARGNIPPRSYGVHAAPVARLLHAYGVKAEGIAGFAWDDLRRQIAEGKPVITWVIGDVWSGYGGTTYRTADGETVLVAAWEHTVIVVSYTPDRVVVIDNNLKYAVPVQQFLASWAVLGNMAVISP